MANGRNAGQVDPIVDLGRLAREGVRLTDAYANGAVCTPTRAALITGQYQQRAGLEWVLEATPGDRSSDR